MFSFFSPFEQFLVHPLYPITFYNFDITISNFTITLFLFLAVVINIPSLIQNKKSNLLFLAPSAIDTFIHVAFTLCQYMTIRHLNIHYFQQGFFPVLFCLATFLLLINLGGNIPGCMSLTSQIGFVCAYAVPMLFGFFFWTLYSRRLTFFRTFHAPGTPGYLAILILPVEILAYLMRPVSLICRLIANFMAGHIIFKVLLGGLVQVLFLSQSLYFSVAISVGLSTCLFIALILLELVISLIQVYVFIVIFCMFACDTLGHHFRH